MNFGQHVRSDRSKWAVTAIAILLIGVILAAILTNGFKDGNPYCWFGHDYDENGICIKCGAEKPAEDPDKEDPDKQPDEDKDELSNLAITPALSKGVRLYAARPTVLENNVITQTLTAFIEPADADNQSVTWSIAWQNPASAFATGKTVTDYVTVEPESAGSLTATVSCLQDFGEKVLITVTSNDNAEIYATCVCDYLQRVEELVFTPSDLVFPEGTAVRSALVPQRVPGEAFGAVRHNWTAQTAKNWGSVKAGQHQKFPGAFLRLPRQFRLGQ